MIPTDERNGHATAGSADAWFVGEFLHSAGERFQLSHATPEHEPFLRALFLDSLAESSARTCGTPTPSMLGQLLDLQFGARQAAYADAHPLACDYLVACRANQAPIGRFLVDWSPKDDRTVWGIDLAVLSRERLGAPGLHLLRAWVTTCDRLRRPAQLHVLPENPARRIYRRLGFVEMALAAFPLQMRREPRSSFGTRSGQPR